MMPEQRTSQQFPQPTPESSFLDLLATLGRYRRMMVVAPFVAAVAMAALTFVLPKTYSATTRILPPQDSGGMAGALLNQVGLGGAASLAGSAMGMKNPPELYVGILQSDSIADALIARFHLRDVYRVQYLVQARQALDKASDIKLEKNGIITISVVAGDPQLSADLANGYSEELQHMTSRLAITDAAQRRVFLEQQLQQAKDKLADAEIKLRKAMGASGLVSVEAQGEALVGTIALLRSQISNAEVAITAMKSFATPDNPDMRRALEQVAGLRKELARLESGMPDKAAAPPPGEATTPRGVENIRLYRDVRYYEELFAALAKQYEIARADEANEGPLVQVVDKASPPERRAGPRRGLLTIAAFLLTLGACVFVARFRADLEDNPSGRKAKLLAVVAAWWPARRPQSS